MAEAAHFKVHSSGAILVGKKVEVDGFFGRPFRVITHFHSDHLNGVFHSVKKARSILATQPTIESLEALGVKIPRTKSASLGYNTPISIGDERLTLLFSRHVFGSAQVLVETENGERDGYTGDFKLPGTPIMKDLDTLILDVTYGSPEMVRRFKREIEVIMIDFIASLLSKGYPVTIYAYYGKMQEVMELLRKSGITAPFLMSSKAFELTRIAVRHGLKISDYFDESSEMGAEIMRTRWFIRFRHYNARRDTSTRAYNLFVTGWIFDRPIREVNYRGWDYFIGYSDHADFEDTIYYVDEARPKNLIVDSTRCSHRTASAFLKEASRRFPHINVLAPLTYRRRFTIRED